MKSRPKFIIPFLAATILYPMLLPSQTSRVDRGPIDPWSVSKRDPVLDEKSAEIRSDKYGIKASPYVSLFWWISFYKLTYATSEGTCTFIPTCSDYMKQAIIKHGLLVGLTMGFERIMRYHHDFDRYKLVATHKGYRLSDPVSDNDFWF